MEGIPNSNRSFTQSSKKLLNLKKYFILRVKVNSFREINLKLRVLLRNKSEEKYYKLIKLQSEKVKIIQREKIKIWSGFSKCIKLFM